MVKLKRGVYIYIYMDIIDQHGTCDGPMWTFSLPSFMSDCLLWDQGGLEDRNGDGQIKKRRKLGRRTHLVWTARICFWGGIIQCIIVHLIINVTLVITVIIDFYLRCSCSYGIRSRCWECKLGHRVFRRRLDSWRLAGWVRCWIGPSDVSVSAVCRRPTVSLRWARWVEPCGARCRHGNWGG